MEDSKNTIASNKMRVRFAPSPTGIPHVGNIRTALFDYFAALSQKGEFILRIEDTDQARKVEGAVDAIKESLEWLGAQWDEFITQSERLEEYKKYAEELVEKGMARMDDGAIRFVVSHGDTKISWVDAIGNKTIEFESSAVEDFIILKKDGYPTYHLANVVDDHLMDITHVIRGEDWIPSTPKHILLYKAFNWNIPVFAHVPNVLGEDGKKLSKRKGAKSVLDFKTDGYLPEALLNYLMLLGWSPKNDQEILTKEEIVKEFSLEKVNSAPATFNTKKLDWMNGEYIRGLSNEELEKRVKEFDPSINELDDSLVAKLVEPAKSRMKLLADFKALVTPFISEAPTPPNPVKEELSVVLGELANWNKDTLIEYLKKFTTDRGVRFPDLYVAIIGEKQGLPLADVFEILGKEKTLSLLQ